MQTRLISTQTNGCWSILMLLLCGKSDSISIKAFFFQGEEGEGKLPKRRLLKKVRRGPPFLIIIMIYPLLDSNNDRVSFGFIKTCLVLEIHTLFSNNFLKDWAFPRHPDVGESKTNDRKSIQLILESYLSLILLCIAFPCRVSDRNLLLSAMTVEPLYLKHNFEGNKLEQSKWIDLCNWSAYLVRVFFHLAFMLIFISNIAFFISCTTKIRQSTTG